MVVMVVMVRMMVMVVIVIVVVVVVINYQAQIFYSSSRSLEKAGESLRFCSYPL